MFRPTMLSLVCCALLACATNSSFAQELVTLASPDATDDLVSADTSVKLNADGELVGSVFATIDGEKQPLEAKVTIAKEDGVVVDTIFAKEDGSFAFPSLEPGMYNMYGSAQDYYGGQSVEVMPYSSGGCVSCDLGLDPTSAVSYDSYASAPASSCGGCGGGGGGGIGSRRFFRLAMIGGIVAIAVSGDNDSSPDN